MRSNAFILLFLAGFLSSVAVALPPPQPIRIEKKLEQLGDLRIDPYFWLRDRENPQVIEYLKKENAYTDFVLKNTKNLQHKLYQEMKGRVEKNDQSAPYSHHGYSYYTRTQGDQEYLIYCRRKGNMEGPEEILVDGNKRAKGSSYFAMTSPSLSPDEKYIAYAVDTKGRRFYALEVYERKSGKKILSIDNTTGNFEWSEDSRTLLYTLQDTETLRAFKILRRNVEELNNELVYEEKDSSFTVSVHKSLSEQLIFINSNSTMTSEVRFLPSDKPRAEPTLVQMRKSGLEYSVEDGVDRLYILTNHEAKNFQLMEVARDQPDLSHWKTVLAHNPEVLIEGIEVYETHIVLMQRQGGLSQIRLVQRKDGMQENIPFSDAAYVVGPYTNADYKAKSFLYSYQSLISPSTVYSWDFLTHRSSVIKQAKVHHYDQSLYTSERVMVKVSDGVEVPLSLVYKKGLKRTGKNPSLIYAYGSYGISMEPSFRASRVSLLDRGFVFAIAHIRGGSEMGRSWYEDGKLLKKKNTFQDFIDCSQWLVDQAYTSPEHLYAMGGSAGGLLMGAVTNMRPDLYHGVIAQVPFVDVITTMLDESIPLTTSEYDEWGDPRKKEYYDYMLSYSPYDNVKDQKYPSLLVTTGLHDSQVQYWEPAKWVAKLRDHNKATTPILLRVNMSAGHGGASGRFAAMKEVSEVYAFMLNFEGIKK